MSAPDVTQMLRPLQLKDLRTECRLRGLNPGGTREALADRVQEHMMATRDFRLLCNDPSLQPQQAGQTTMDMNGGRSQNNYSRPAGQNVGNFLTDRPTSRVLAAPGGGSQIVFGEYQDPASSNQYMTSSNTYGSPSRQAVGPPQGAGGQWQQSPPPGYNAGYTGSPSRAHQEYSSSPNPNIGVQNNNYHRPAGQNVGNFITDKPSSRVLAPPGGKSQISFG